MASQLAGGFGCSLRAYEGRRRPHALRVFDHLAVLREAQGLWLPTAS